MIVPIISLASGLILCLALLINFLPDKVRYVESVVINSDVKSAYDAIREQKQLMKWSAWPRETKSSCQVENEDGKIGAKMTYLNKKGRKFGYQEVIELEASHKVAFYLKSFVAPFEKDVRLTFYLREKAPELTEVSMWFDEELKKPHFLIAYFGGIIKWVHSMHLKDLANLKSYLENDREV